MMLLTRRHRTNPRRATGNSIVTLNLYVMPLVTATDARGRTLTRQPKYTSTIASFPNRGMVDYGNEPWCLVGVVDITVAADTALKANADVIALPVNLDQQIGAGPLAKVRSDLESVNIPGTWVQATNTWREVVRFVCAVSEFAQRYQGQTGSLWFTGGVTLATTYGTLPQSAQNGILSAAQSFGFDTSGLVAGSTLRQILVSVGNQYLAAGMPVTIAMVAL